MAVTEGVRSKSLAGGASIRSMAVTTDQIPIRHPRGFPVDGVTLEHTSWRSGVLTSQGRQEADSNREKGTDDVGISLCRLEHGHSANGILQWLHQSSTSSSQMQLARRQNLQTDGSGRRGSGFGGE